MGYANIMTTIRANMKLNKMIGNIKR